MKEDTKPKFQKFSTLTGYLFNEILYNTLTTQNYIHLAKRVKKLEIEYLNGKGRPAD